MVALARSHVAAGRKAPSVRAPVIQRRCECGGRCPSCRSREAESWDTPYVQAKLKIGPPDDEYEREADRVAERVMRMPEPTIQRQVHEEEDEEGNLLSAKPSVQRRTMNDRGVKEVPTIVGDVLHANGNPLDLTARRFMESRMGRDFGDVRVHSGTQAAEAAKAIDARAFTSGRNVVFAANEYSPQSAEGRRLLAHELAHVVQQNGSASTGAGCGSTVQRQQQPQRQSLLLTSAPEFRGCSPYQRFRLDYQIVRARSFVRSGIDALSDELNRAANPGLGIITIAGSALRRYFHTENPRHMRTIKSRLERILDRLNRGPRNWRCRSTAGCRSVCEPSRTAPLACAGPRGSVSVCPPHFEQGNTEGSLTLIHESAHQAGLGLRTTAGHRTDIYEFETRRFANLTPHQAMNTPDAYAAFVRDIMYGGQIAAGQAWSAREMKIIGSIEVPDINDLVGVAGDASIGLGRIPPRTTVENQFKSRFVFDAADGSGERRPDFLRNPEVSLKIVLRRGGSRGNRPRQSVLFDQSARVAPNEFGRMNPSGTANGYGLDYSFDTMDRGILLITARIRDEDTATTLVYRDRVRVRPTATTGSSVPSQSPSE